jgi:two-component system response regulator RegA
MSAPLLLVDDDGVFLEALARSLRRRGETVLTARNAAEALAQLGASAPDRAVLDLNLEGDSGLQLLQLLHERAPALRIVILTGYGSIATAVEAMRRGAFNYLCKPATAGDVLSAFTVAQGVETEMPPATETPLSVDRLTWEHIQRVLQEHQGNVSATARALKMHRRTLQRKLLKRPASG